MMPPKMRKRRRGETGSVYITELLKIAIIVLSVDAI